MQIEKSRALLRAKIATSHAFDYAAPIHRRLAGGNAVQTLSAGSNTNNQTRHYAALDGMRGVAAIAVVIAHAGGRFFGQHQPGSAYLAVDLFFVLSGFVIAHAYGSKLCRSLTPRDFMAVRVLRLFPLYLAGVALTALAVLTALTITNDASTWNGRYLAIASLLALFMLPSPVGIQGVFFPLNFPTWSLFYEMVVNLAYATCRGRLGWMVWGLVTAVSGSGIVAQSFIFEGVDQGALWKSTAWALARVSYSFPLGVILYRHHHRLTASGSYTLTLCAALVVLLCLNPSGIYRSFYDAAFVLVLSPAIVLFGAVSAPGGDGLNATYRALGTISYPIYVLHDPVIAILSGLSRRHFSSLVSPASTPWSGVGLLLSLMLVSWAAARGDAAFRRWVGVKSVRHAASK